MKGCDVYVTSKTIRHKFYGDLQLLPVPTYHWKDLSINFVTGLLRSTNRKGETYDSILVIVDRLMKIVHYELVNVIIDTPGLIEVIINMVIKHHNLPDSIVSNYSLVFTFKF